MLELAGLDYTIRKKEIDESYPDDLHIDEIAEYLAIKKANAQSEILNDNEILLTADTIVALDGKEYGKPTSRDDSIRMLGLLSNRDHEVYTGVCLSTKHQQKSFTCRSVVKFSEITEEEAAWYFDNYDPSDKAGSYGIQDWVGKCKVEWINGSYTNILGLPVAQTLAHLRKFLEQH